MRSRGLVPILALPIALLANATPALARDRLGIWDDWGAFRDVSVPRCYAIAMAVDPPGRANEAKGRETQGYATVAIWPRRDIHGEVHVRLSRTPAPGRPVNLRIGGQSFALVSSGIDAWAADRRMDAGIVAALRAGGDMTVTARGRDARLFHDFYRLSGAASAIDAASLGCAAS